ncbi:MAG: hypothetical protein HC775_19995 [Hyellaceae cyanobacterium CSU_1_1]|nr:hypothetical protein [Hyellaceae cyanobacterium CSU_1_1]
MNQSELSPIEKAIARKIDKTKDKASKPGYLRTLVAKLHLRIEAALARGCEYDDLAESITESGVKISTATLKQYHTEYRRSLNEEAEDQPNTVKSILPTELPKEIEEISERVNQPNQKQSAIDKLFASK